MIENNTKYGQFDSIISVGSNGKLTDGSPEARPNLAFRRLHEEIVEVLLDIVLFYPLL